MLQHKEEEEEEEKYLKIYSNNQHSTQHVLCLQHLTQTIFNDAEKFVYAMLLSKNPREEKKKKQQQQQLDLFSCFCKRESCQSFFHFFHYENVCVPKIGFVYDTFVMDSHYNYIKYVCCNLHRDVHFLEFKSAFNWF